MELAGGLGGYSGKQVVVTLPILGGSGDNYSSDCDEQAFRIWNAEGFNIYSQGGEQLWRLYILDVEGTRVVVMDEDFQTSRTDLPQQRQELDSIFDSIEITTP